MLNKIVLPLNVMIISIRNTLQKNKKGIYLEFVINFMYICNI